MLFRSENPCQHAGALLGGVHAGHLHTYHPPDAAGRSGENWWVYDRCGAVRRRGGQGKQERIARREKTSPEEKAGGKTSGPVGFIGGFRHSTDPHSLLQEKGYRLVVTAYCKSIGCKFD